MGLATGHLPGSEERFNAREKVGSGGFAAEDGVLPHAANTQEANRCKVYGEERIIAPHERARHHQRPRHA
jgi:hypothetical protein